MACVTIQLSKRKSFECQIELFNKMSEDYIFCINGHWSIRRDHAGPSLMIIIWRLVYFHVAIYDHRHWNYDENRWYKDDENQCPDYDDDNSSNDSFHEN